MNSPLSFVLFLISHPEVREKEYCIKPRHLEMLWVANTLLRQQVKIGMFYLNSVCHAV